MIEALILASVFHLGTILFLMYYPSKSTGTGFHSEIGFVMFLASQIFFVLAAYYFVKNENRRHVSYSIGAFLVLNGVAYDFLKVFSLLLNRFRKANFLEFFGPTIEILGLNVEYFYGIYLAGIVIVVLTFLLSRQADSRTNVHQTSSRMPEGQQHRSLRQVLVEYREQRKGVLEAYVIATISSLLISTILVLGIASVAYFSGNFVHIIAILIFSNLVSMLVTILITLAAIQRQWFNIDKTKLFIRKNTSIFTILFVLVLFTLEDVLYITFFARSFSTEPFYWLLRDTLINSFYIGLIYMLIGLGITLVYKILRFANFAQAELVTIGGYMGFLFSYIAIDLGIFQFFEFLGPAFQWVFIYLILVMVTFVFTIPFGLLFDKTVFKPLRDRNAEPFSIMIASFGLGLAVREILRQVFSSTVLKLNPFLEGLELDDNLLQIYIILVILLITWIIYILFYRTKLGKMLRAVADNPDLARNCGIKPEKVFVYLWVLAAGFAGVAGLLYSSYQIGSTRIRPELGFLLLLSAFAVAILGGIGSFEGLLIASFIIGFTENFGSIVLGQLKSLDITFSIPFLIVTDVFVALILLVIGGILIQVTRRQVPDRAMKNVAVLGVLGAYVALLFGLSSFLPWISVDAIEASLEFGNGYRLALSFGILILVLLVRPQGILGEKESGDR